MKTSILLIRVVLLSLLSLSSHAQNSNSDLILINDTVPDLTFTTISGKVYNTTELKGKVIVVDFWYIHCAPCIAILPELLKLEQKYRNKNVVFLSLSMDTADETQRLLDRKSISLDAIPNTQRIHELFNVKVYPAMIIIDKNGIVRKQVLGGLTDYLEELLKEEFLLN